MRATSRKAKGLSLLEVTLVAVIGLVMLSGAVAGVRQYQAQSRISTCKMHLAALRQAVNLYKFRTGFWPQLMPGDSLGATSASAARTYVGWTAKLRNAALVNDSSLTVDVQAGYSAPPVGSHLVINDGAGVTNWVRVVAVSGSTILSVAPPLTSAFPGGGSSSGTSATLHMAGLFNNLDDTDRPFLNVGAPPAAASNPDVGNGLGDRWLGVANIRRFRGGAAEFPSEPTWDTSCGYRYDSGLDRGNFGGLSYDVKTGDVHYVLPSCGSSFAGNPVGDFSGDTPFDWER